MADDAGFQQWYAVRAKRWGLDPNPDDPRHHYDYRAAYRAGAEPDPQTGHWSSEFKAKDHPNRFVDGVDTITGKPMDIHNSTLYDTRTRQPVEMDPAHIPEAIAKGLVAYKVGARLNVRKPNGDAVSIDAADLVPAVKQGFTLETPMQSATRQYVEENKGLRGSVKVALTQFADEALLGLPEMVYQKTGDPFEVAKWEALKEEHNVANAMGGFGGFVAGTLGLGVLTGGAGIGAEAGIEGVTRAAAAGTAEKIVAKGFLEKAAAEGIIDKAAVEATADKWATTMVASKLEAAGVSASTGKTMAQTILTKAKDAAIRGGFQGVAGVAPQAITETALGDPGQAAETLLIGLGAGVVLGPMAEAGGALTHRGVALAQKAMLNPAMPKAIGAATGTVVGGLAGHGWGALIGEHLGGAAGGLLLTEQTMKKAALQLDRIPALLDRLSATGFSAPLMGGNALAQLHSHLDYQDKAEGLKELNKRLSILISNPQAMNEKLAPVVNALEQGGAPNIAAAYAAKTTQVIQALHDAIPKPTAPDDPLTPTKWKPTISQIDDFDKMLEVVNDPFVVLDHLNGGTLTKKHVEALHIIAPKMHDAILDRMLKHIYDQPDGKPMTYAVAQKVKLLMGVNDITPTQVVSMQSSFNANKPAGQGRTKLKKLPDLITPTQTMTYK